MFTIISSNISSWFQQKEHGFSIDTRLGFDFFLLAYRSVLVSRTAYVICPVFTFSIA